MHPPIRRRAAISAAIEPRLPRRPGKRRCSPRGYAAIPPLFPARSHPPPRVNSGCTFPGLILGRRRLDNRSVTTTAPKDGTSGPAPAAAPGQAGAVVRMLGPFSVTARGRSAGPWPRPSARRLCALVLVSPGRRVRRDLACEELFPGLDPHAAARALSKALSMARAALAPLGEAGASLLHADLAHIWAAADAAVDAEVQLIALREGLRMGPGERRDKRAVAAPARPHPQRFAQRDQLDLGIDRSVRRRPDVRQVRVQQ